VAYLSVGSEYFINNQELEDKVRNLLPSQGGAGAGFDLSASTQIIPIIDLTESAEGSNVRADLQTAISHTTANVFSVVNATTTVINTTGYFKISGVSLINVSTSSIRTNIIQINDGTTTKDVWKHIAPIGSNNSVNTPIDFNVFLDSGDSLIFNSDSIFSILTGSVRQIADIAGNLTNP